jgi:hypothetical protein
MWVDFEPPLWETDYAYVPWTWDAVEADHSEDEFDFDLWVDDWVRRLGVAQDEDDRPDWLKALHVAACSRCGRSVFEPNRRVCTRCRDERCEFCNVDPISYPGDYACKSCYRWLQRHRGDFATVTELWAAIEPVVARRIARRSR